jgi:predicted nucleotidyltransferase
MASLNDLERACLERYCGLLAERLGDDLTRIRIFGSAARGDMWPERSPMHSDIDLLVVVRRALGEPEAEELLNETYPLYLECGRQISPHFFTQARLAAPENGRTGAFLAAVAADGVDVWPAADHAASSAARAVR